MTPTATTTAPTRTLSEPLSSRASPLADARLQHLFRASLKAGRIHPLYLPMLKYRQMRSLA